MSLASMALFNGCGSKHIPMPEPVYGRDILRVDKNMEVPFKGTLFSDYYLDHYLQWKNNDNS